MHVHGPEIVPFQVWHIRDSVGLARTRGFIRIQPTPCVSMFQCLGECLWVSKLITIRLFDERKGGQQPASSLSLSLSLRLFRRDRNWEVIGKNEREFNLVFYPSLITLPQSDGSFHGCWTAYTPPGIRHCWSWTKQIKSYRKMMEFQSSSPFLNGVTRVWLNPPRNQIMSLERVDQLDSLLRYVSIAFWKRLVEKYLTSEARCRVFHETVKVQR